MARKPRSQWSEAYRRRMERGEARGLSRQVARGHKRAEHIARRARERAERETGARLDTRQRGEIRKLVRQQLGTYRNGLSVEGETRRIEQEVLRNGWQSFLALRRQQRQLAAAYRGVPMMDVDTLYSQYAGLMGFAEDDTYLLFYHS